VKLTGISRIKRGNIYESNKCTYVQYLFIYLLLVRNAKWWCDYNESEKPQKQRLKKTNTLTIEARSLWMEAEI
jgi:hypothetical protein